MTIEQRHRCMSHIRSSDTKPEVALRRGLWRRGFRYRVNVKKLPGSPDLVLAKYHSVVFVHGCFWHGHEGCAKYTVPRSNTAFWVEKVARNRERDQAVWRKLEVKGWSVVIVWECGLTKEKLPGTVEEVIRQLHENKVLWERRKEERQKLNREHREALRQREERMALHADRMPEPVPRRIARLSKEEQK